MEQDPNLAMFTEDPEFAELLEMIIDELFESIMDELQGEFENAALTFEDGFDRLIDDEGSVLVRQ